MTKDEIYVIRGEVSSMNRVVKWKLARIIRGKVESTLPKRL